MSGRREVLIALVAAACGVGLGLAVRPSFEERPAPDWLKAELETFRSVGFLYLTENPDQDDLESLSARIPPEILTDPDALDRQIRAEYRAGQTGTILGWVLSETEITLCAMLALQSS